MPIKTKTETEEKVRDFTQEAFHWSNEWREANIDSILVDSMRLYMGQIDETQGLWKWINSKLFIPKTNSIVEAILPKMFGFEPTFNILPREDTDEVQARIMEAVLKYYLFKMKFPYKLTLWGRNNAIYGFAPVKIVWRTQNRLMRRDLSAEEINYYSSIGETPPDKQDYPVTIYDGPDIVNIDPFDYFWSPNASELDEMSFQMHRSTVTMDYLRRMERRGIYHNIGDVEDNFRPGPQGVKPHEAAKRERDEIIKTQRRDSVIPQIHEEITLYENQCSLPLVDKGDNRLVWDDKADHIPVIATTAGLDTVIRIQRVPWDYRDHNFVKTNFIPIHNLFIGMGVPQLIKGLQNVLNFRHSMALDNMNLTTNTMWLRRRGAMIRDFQLRNRPGGIIDTNDMEGIKPLEVNDMTDVNLRYTMVIEDLIEDTTNVSKLTKGIESGSELNRTASGIMALQRAAETKIKYAQLAFEWMGLREAGGFFIQLIQENAPPEMILRITGEKDPIVVRPEDLIGQYDLVPYVGVETDIDKEGMQNRIMAAYDRLMNSPMAGSYNWAELDRRVLETLDIKDIGKIIPENMLNVPAAAMMPPGQEGGGGPAKQMGAGGPNLQVVGR